MEEPKGYLVKGENGFMVWTPKPLYEKSVI